MPDVAIFGHFVGETALAGVSVAYRGSFAIDAVAVIITLFMVKRELAGLRKSAAAILS